LIAILRKIRHDRCSSSAPTIVEEAEKAIVQALKAANNNRSQAAQLLGISRRAFYDKLAQYNLDTSSLQ
jgi:DNA-binding NtrC family response regulator